MLHSKSVTSSRFSDILSQSIETLDFACLLKVVASFDHVNTLWYENINRLAITGLGNLLLKMSRTRWGGCIDDTLKNNISVQNRLMLLLFTLLLIKNLVIPNLLSIVL